MTIASFRHIKSTWGIAIDIAISEYHDLQNEWDDDHSIVNVTDSIHLVYSRKKNKETGRVILLGNEALNYLCNAFYNARHMITQKVNVAVYYHIEELEYPITDFQDEGMYCVGINWLNKQYGFNLELPEITFDKENNRYDFTFPVSIEAIV